MKILQIRRTTYETYKDNQCTRFKEGHREIRMWRMPDILPVGMQDELHRCKPEVRAEITVHGDLTAGGYAPLAVIMSAYVFHTDGRAVKRGK